MLTPEIVRELRKPFLPEQVKWKIQTNPRDGEEYAVVVAYLDARDITERLDLASGGDWSNEYTLPQVQAGIYAVLECRLTICGVTRCDVGSVPVPDKDDATKDLYSDALKRAAVQFGVAAHVYRFPTVKAKVEKFGKSFYLTYRAKDELLALNRCLIGGTKPPRYTEIKVFGDSWGADGNAALFDEPTAPTETNGKRPIRRTDLMKRIEELEAILAERGYDHQRESFDAYTDEQLIEIGKRLKAEFDKPVTEPSGIVSDTATIP